MLVGCQYAAIADETGGVAYMTIDKNNAMGMDGCDVNGPVIRDR